MGEIDFSKIYSFSKLKRFESCPLGYYFYYLDPKWKGYKKPKDYKTKGQAVHGAITLFYYLPPKERTFQNLKGLLEKAWFSETNSDKEPPLGKTGGFENLRHERTAYAQSLKLLKNFFYLEKPNPPIFYLPTKKIKDSFEDYEELIKPINDEFFISGKFDRIDRLGDGSLRVIDFKTSKNKQDKFQLIFYKLLAELNFDIPVKTVSFYKLDEKKILNFDVKNIDKDEIKSQVWGKIKNIKNSKNFNPKVSRLCAHCDFFDICPAKNNLKNEKSNSC
jgi:putative RecB family exonuclease